MNSAEDCGRALSNPFAVRLGCSHISALLNAGQQRSSLQREYDITQGAADATTTIFVGVDAYEAAGGLVVDTRSVPQPFPLFRGSAVSASLQLLLHFLELCPSTRRVEEATLFGLDNLAVRSWRKVTAGAP